MIKRESPILDPRLIRQLEQLELVVKRLLAGRQQGEKRSKRRGTGSEFADYRDYTQGDDPRFIDWNVYARLDRLFLRLFHEEEDLRISIYLDASGSMSFGDPQKLLYAKRIAAALAYVGLVHHDRVVVDACHESGVVSLRPARGKHNVWRLLEFLETIEPTGGTDLREGLKRFTRRNSAPGMKVVISDFLDKEGYEAALKWLLRGPDTGIVIQVLSPEEVKPKLAGDFILEDCEDGMGVEVSMTAGLLKRYDRNLKALVGGLREYCRARGLAYYFAPTSTPVEQVILTSLRRTGVLR